MFLGQGRVAWAWETTNMIAPIQYSFNLPVVDTHVQITTMTFRAEIVKIFWLYGSFVLTFVADLKVVENLDLSTMYYAP